MPYVEFVGQEASECKFPFSRSPQIIASNQPYEYSLPGLGIRVVQFSNPVAKVCELKKKLIN